MPLRHKRIEAIAPFEHTPCSDVAVSIADVGRALGSIATGLAIQRIKPGFRSSRKHRHIFQEEMLFVMEGKGLLLHGDEHVQVNAGDAFCYLPGDAEAHAFENTGDDDLIIWAFGDRLPHEVCVYPEQNTVFIEGLGADIPLDKLAKSIWTEARRPK